MGKFVKLNATEVSCIPWDPVSTPFSSAELIKLACANKQTVGSIIEPCLPGNWRHPDDPLGRMSCYTFWDVLQQALILALYQGGVQELDDTDLVSEFIDVLSEEVENLIESDPRDSRRRLPETYAGCILVVVNEIEKHVKRSKQFPRSSASNEAGLLYANAEVHRYLLDETRELIARIEIMLGE